MNPTERELEIIKLLCEGKSRKEIASELGIAKSTVKNNLSRIFSKFKVGNAVEMVVTALQQDIIDLDDIEIDYYEKKPY